MLRIALWLFCLIHALQGRRVQTVWAQEPSASFLPSSPGARIPMGSSSWTHPRPAVSKGQGQTRFGRRIQEISMSEEESDSIPLQIAQLSKKIAYLTVHTQKDRKDFYSLRGLSRMVQKRRKLLQYLLRTDRPEFLRVTSGLRIRTTKLLLPKPEGVRGIQQLARLEGKLQKQTSPREEEAEERQKQLQEQLR
mmetsp:Transcript_72186/g.136323  ORF Transcript_72186/g.136323 Transcript_72186/m.136323 type:complete len:193 (+) Transcript_72186:88-666(+)